MDTRNSVEVLLEKNNLLHLKKQEAAFKESEQKYRLIAENVDDILLLASDSRNVIYCSPSIEKTLGYQTEEFMELFCNGQVLPYINAAIGKLAAQEQEEALSGPVRSEVEQICKDGSLVWLEALISKAKDGEGRKIGFLCVIRDITQRKQAENGLRQSYERRLRNEFFVRLLKGNVEWESDIYNHAYRLGIPLPQNFSLYFLQFDHEKGLPVTARMTEERQKKIDILIDRLTREKDSIAWEAAEGIGILSAVHETWELKEEEIRRAEAYLEIAEAFFPHWQLWIGIGDYFESLNYVTLRFKHAQSAARVGKGTCGQKRVYHFDNCGVYQVLIPFADSDEAELFIQKTLGPLLEYDKRNQTALVDTLEKILSGLSLKEVAEQMFFHYKTIQSRKQRIESILKVSLESSEVRITLATAVRLLKISRHRQLS